MKNENISEAKNIIISKPVPAEILACLIDDFGLAFQERINE